MSKARWLRLALLSSGFGQLLLSACGNGERPGSFVGEGAAAGRTGGFTGNIGGSSGEAGQAASDAGSSNGGDGGAADEEIAPAAPIAIFPDQLSVDQGCGSPPQPAPLLIRNGGILPLIISEATTTGGYVVKSELPLQIPAMSGATLLVAPPVPEAAASVGDVSRGSLSFVTNEENAPTHEVQLNTTLFGGVFEFTDGDGTPLSNALALTYLSSDRCPDRVKYRVHNSGNLAFTLFGPMFPPHLGGTSAGASGRSVAPNGYVELEVGGNSASDGACSGGGDLSFTVQGSVCGTVPRLNVIWPAHVQTTGCTCAASE